MSVTQDYEIYKKPESFDRFIANSGHSAKNNSPEFFTRLAPLNLVEQVHQDGGGVLPFLFGDYLGKDGANGNTNSADASKGISTVGGYSGFVRISDGQFFGSAHISSVKKRKQCSSGFAGRADYWRRIGTPAREARLALFIENGLAALASVVLIALPPVLDAAGWLRG